MAGVYDEPRYYELAFGFRDIAAEVDVLETCARRWAGIPVRRFLELGSGNSPHLVELCRRGYAYVGLDQNEHMLAFSRERARAERAAAQLIRGDMVAFDLPEPVDFAFVMLGSLFVRSTAELRSHLASVGRAVRPGGLYLLDWCVHFETPTSSGPETWTAERDGIVVVVEHTPTVVDRVEQTFEERLRLRVNDHGREVELEDRSVRRAIYPQELLVLLGAQGDFEFIGWWNDSGPRAAARRSRLPDAPDRPASPAHVGACRGPPRHERSSRLKVLAEP